MHKSNSYVINNCLSKWHRSLFILFILFIFSHLLFYYCGFCALKLLIHLCGIWGKGAIFRCRKVIKTKNIFQKKWLYPGMSFCINYSALLVLCTIYVFEKHSIWTKRNRVIYKRPYNRITFCVKQSRSYALLSNKGDLEYVHQYVT